MEVNSRASSGLPRKERIGDQKRGGGCGGYSDEREESGAVEYSGKVLC